MLWNKRLGHVSHKRNKRHEKEWIIPSLRNDFIICMECIKRKKTKTKRIGSILCQNLLEIIHADIFGSFPTPTLNRQQYFARLIEDFQDMNKYT